MRKRTLCLAIFGAALAACGGAYETGGSTDAGVAPTRVEEPAAAVESTTQALSAGGQSFGSTSRGSNFDCFGEVCTCDTGIPTDCLDLFHSIVCGGGDLDCEYSEDLRRSICHCKWVTGPDPMCAPPHHCPIATAFPKTGVWFYDDKWHMRLPEGDRTCTLTTSQCAPGSACQTGATTASGNMYFRLKATEPIPAQTCSNVEAGTLSNAYADGHYRGGNGSIYKKIGKRQCYETWDFYHNKEHDPSFTQMPSNVELDFLIRYSDGASPVLPCNDKDI